MVTVVKKGRVLKVLKDGRLATLEDFLGKMPKDKVREVCMGMKEKLRKVVESLLPQGKVVVGGFRVIADSNRWMDEARRIEQDTYQKKKSPDTQKHTLAHPGSGMYR